MMKISGKTVELVAAGINDRGTVYQWLAHSDLTPSMMGPPHYPDHPVPTWEEFSMDYSVDFFSGTGQGKGSVFLIKSAGVAVGSISYDLLDEEKRSVVLDIWLRSENDCGKGYGSEALELLCGYLHARNGITDFIISPSVRNKRAVAAYTKAGFRSVKVLNKIEQEELFGVSETNDNLLMIKKID